MNTHGVKRYTTSQRKSVFADDSVALGSSDDSKILARAAATLGGDAVLQGKTAEEEGNPLIVAAPAPVLPAPSLASFVLLSSIFNFTPLTETVAIIINMDFVVDVAFANQKVASTLDRVENIVSVLDFESLNHVDGCTLFNFYSPLINNSTILEIPLLKSELKLQAPSS